MFEILEKAESLQMMATAPKGGLSEAELVDAIRAAEDLKAVAAAAQVVATQRLAIARTVREEREGLGRRRRGQGLASEVGLARGESPHRGAQHLGVARALAEMPCTFAALASGRLSEWRATIMVRETAYVCLEARQHIDRVLAGSGGKLAGIGDRELVAEARRLAYAIDPHAVVARSRRAVGDRHVSVRPAPDVMSRLSALLPVAQGVACYAALKAAAESARATGDERSRGQVMADTLVERITGRAAAQGPDLEVKVVLSDRALLAGDAEPAHLEGYGTVPAQVARDLIRHALDQVSDHRVALWVRQLYTHPVSGALVAMASRRRCAPGGLSDFVATRDRTCRTPWCDAPIRHTDHIWAAMDGGPTEADNTQGLCEACNYAKQAPGWRARSSPGLRHLVITTTPTGHSYRSTAPPAIGHRASAGETYQTPDLELRYEPSPA